MMSIRRTFPIIGARKCNISHARSCNNITGPAISAPSMSAARHNCHIGEPKLHYTNCIFLPPQNPPEIVNT
ncbi:hypothetical protein Scep_007923 [Stephania cephalantha]|uniref:Uncharacterized protein n=1 Tax=Stephania cephalantha TaxID=152367 RepID=A0AAP0KAR6_9MAGN